MLDLKNGHFKAARESLDEGLKIDTSLRQAAYRVELGVLSLKYEDYVKAEDCFRKVLAYDKFNPKGNIGLGICLYKKGGQEEALKLFEQAMISKILEYPEIKEFPGIEKALKDKRFKELRDKYYR
jgi:tetratricopeptide (TPR) repeat protein